MTRISIALPARHESIGDQVAFHPERVVESADFAVFWRDEFGAVHFFASDRESWDRYFDEHEDDESLPGIVEHDEQGRIE